MLELGHRRLVLVNGPSTVSWCRNRKKGVMQAVLEAGRDAAVALQEVEVDGLTVAEGAESVDSLLRQDKGGRAVICANDLLALGVLIGLRRRGLDVPRDYALAGFDDLDFAAALLPALTSVRQPARDMGAAAVQLLLEQPSSGAKHVRFEPELMVRESTASAGVQTEGLTDLAPRSFGGPGGLV